MPNSLTDNLDTDFIERLNALRPDDALPRVQVYVEGHDDEAFWHDILKDYESQKNIAFDITPYSRDNRLAKNKLEVLKHADDTGKYLILCVDSDYDYLLPNHSDSSIKINSDKYIFQTYAYSIENLKCYKESLQGVCVRATKNSKQEIYLSKLLKMYSNIIYPLLLWSLYFASKNDTTTFTIDDFSSDVKILSNPDINTQCQATIRNIKQKVQTKVTQLEQTYSTDNQQFELLSKQLHELGLNENTAYLFMNGHTLFNNVVLMILKPLCRELRKKKIREIHDKAQDSTELKNQIQNYSKKAKKDGEVETLSTNTDFKTCFLYQKIKTDLDLYIKNFN